MHFDLRGAVEWSGMLDSVLAEAALPPLLAAPPAREAYFRAALLGEERVACGLLLREFRSGPHSIAAFLDRSPSFIKLRSSLGVSARDVSRCSPADFVTSSDAADSVMPCEFSSILNGLDPFSSPLPPSALGLAGGSVMLDFVGSFWTRSRPEKVRIVDGMADLVGAAECATGGIRARASSAACAACALDVLRVVLNGMSSDSEIYSVDTAGRLASVLALEGPIDALLSRLHTLRGWVADGGIPSLARLGPETAAARYSFLGSLGVLLPADAVELLRLRRPAY